MTDSILISGGRLIDGTGAPPLEKSIINIQGGRIEKVGVSGQVQIPSNVPVIDASGMTVIPGLIDAHVHITGPYDPNETNIVLSILKTPPPLSALWAVRNANVCLEAGYTTLRDLGVFLTRDNIEMVSVRRGIDLGLVDGPRLVVAGIVVQTSSHPELAALGRISPLVYTNYGTSDGPWEVRKRVRHLVGLDVDWIKVMASGWGGEVEKHWWPNFTLEELTALCDEAHRYRKRVAAHTASSATMLDAARAGCDTLEHLVDIDDQTIEAILERNITLVPTLSVFSDQALSRRSQHQKSNVIGQLQFMREQAFHSFQCCLQAGVRIATGTDIYRTVLPGENALEVALMVQYGMSEMEAIIAATKNSAEAVGLSEELGTLTPDKWADLLLIEGDPLQDIHILEDKSKIRLVMKGGRSKSIDG